MNVETGTPVEPFMGPVVFVFTVGATVSIVTEFVATAAGVAVGVFASYWTEPGYMAATNACAFVAPSSVCMTTK